MFWTLLCYNFILISFPWKLLYNWTESSVHALQNCSMREFAFGTIGMMSFAIQSLSWYNFFEKVMTFSESGKYWSLGFVLNISFSFLADFHKTAPYVVTGSVDQTVKVWECRWLNSHLTPFSSGCTQIPWLPIELCLNKYCPFM